VEEKATRKKSIRASKPKRSDKDKKVEEKAVAKVERPESPYVITKMRHKSFLSEKVQA
jgi:hypothetical protein